MNNAHEEAERILNLVKQLKEGSADEKLQAQIIESALVRERNEARKHHFQEAIRILQYIPLPEPTEESPHKATHFMLGLEAAIFALEESNDR